MFRGIDFFSDTMTRPTPGMRQAIANAEVGDEQMGEDPTTLKLEEKIAGLLGKSAALFFPCATMANEAALKFHCKPGDELMAAADCHLFFAETGGPAVHAQALARPIPTETGVFTGEDIRKYFRFMKGAHNPVSRVVSVENTTNLGGGVPWPLEALRSVTTTAKELAMATHLDGARLFNAAVASQVSVKTLAEGFDTVTICLSKGLGCPAGALLAFSEAHFAEFRRLKQLMGGALRQSGILSSAGLYALEHHVARLEQDHQNAKRLAQGLSQGIAQISVETPLPSTNMVYFQWTSKKVSAQQFSDRCIAQGIRFSHVGTHRFRAVTHLDITSQDVDKALIIVRDICRQIGV